MSKKKQRKKESRYIPPEMMPYMLCTACLGVIIDQNEQAREIFQGIVECGYLPGYQMMQEKAGDIIPDNRTLLKEIIEKSGYDYQKPPRSVVDGISYARGMIKGSKEIVSKYTDRVMPEVQKKILIERDLNILGMQIDILVKIGFNREEDQRKGKYKVILKDDSKLGDAILINSLSISSKNLLSMWEKVKIIEYAGNRYSISEIIHGGAALRLHRQLVNQYKKSGFLLKHDETLEKIAWDWYQSRVVYSGPAEYCRQLSLENEIDLDPANVSNEIKECDEAVGYPRSKKKRL